MPDPKETDKKVEDAEKRFERFVDELGKLKEAVEEHGKDVDELTTIMTEDLVPALDELKRTILILTDTLHKGSRKGSAPLIDLGGIGDMFSSGGK